MPKGQIIPVNFRGGIEEKMDPRQVPPGTILSLVNCRQKKTGRLEKRYGSTGGSTALSRMDRLFARVTEQCAIGNVGGLDLAMVYSKSTSTGNFVQQDNVSEAACRRDPVQSLDTVWIDPDVAYGSGLEIWTWRTNEGGFTDGTVYAMVRDALTGTVLVRAQALSSAVSVTPKVVVCGTKAVLFYGTFSTATIYYRVLDLANPTAGWGAQTALRADADVSANAVYFDVTVNGANIYLFYWSTQGTKLQLYRYNNALAQQANSGVVDASGTYSALALCVDPLVTNLYIAFGQTGAAGGKLRAAVRHVTTLVAVVAPYDLRTPGTVQSMQAIGMVARTAAIVLVTGSWLNPNLNPTEGFIIDNAGAGTSVGSIPWANQLSRPVLYSGNFYQMFWKTGQGTHYLATWSQAVTAGVSPLRVVGVFGPRIAHNALSGGSSGSHGQNHLCSVVSAHQVGSVVGDGFVTATGTLADAASKQHVNLWRARIDFADRWLMAGDPLSTARMGTAQLALVTHLSGGFAQYYDGLQVAETACLEQIDSTQITLTPAGAGGGLSQGTYLFTFYWEWSDAQGLIHRSLPSIPLAVTTAGVGTVNKVTCKVPTLTFTNMGWKTNPFPKPYLVICRTPVNGLAVATYRVTMPDDIKTGALNLNDPTAAYITIDDTLADATLTTHPLCYTATGALENACPSACQHLCVHRGRIIFIGDDAKTIWASTQQVNGEAVRYNEILQMQGEDVLVACASLDDKLVLFGERQIWVVYGDGPNDLGVQSDWTTPMPIATDIGCVSAFSVVRIGEGILFQSRRGMYILGRNLELTALKQPTDTVSTHPICCCSVAQTDDELVLWSMRTSYPSAQLDGIRLVFDTFHKVWGTDLMNSQPSAENGVMAMAVIGGSLYWAHEDGALYVEDKTLWTDKAVWFDASFEIMGPNDTMNFKRVRKAQTLGQRYTPHNFKLSFAFDYGGYVQNFLWSDTRITTLGHDNLELRVGAQNGANPRCRSMKVKGEILAPTSGAGVGTGQAASFSGIGFDIVPKPSLPRLGSANAST